LVEGGVDSSASTLFYGTLWDCMTFSNLAYTHSQLAHERETDGAELPSPSPKNTPGSLFAQERVKARQVTNMQPTGAGGCKKGRSPQ
jgi:hypothetical protein